MLRLLDNRHTIAKCHLNMGNALVCLSRHAEAHEHFETEKNFNSDFRDDELELMIDLG